MLELFVCLTLCCIKNGPSNLEEQGAPCLSGRIVLIYAQSAVYTESLTLKTWFGDFHNSWYFFNLQMSVQRLTMTTAWLKSPSPIHTRTMYDQSLSTIKGKIALCLYNISHISDLCPDLFYNLWALASLLREKIVIWTLSVISDFLNYLYHQVTLQNSLLLPYL